MSNYALIDANGGIVNRIVLNDPQEWAAPAGYIAVLEPADATYEIGGAYLNGVYAAPPAPPLPPPPPQTVVPQDLMAQFTADDAAKIQVAIAGNVQFWLLWSAMQAQRDPMIVTNARFLAGWNALVQVLGASRMAAIATSLGVAVG